ncbi:MAG: histidine phosphatase family protein [Hyphomicrobiales bacterium]|nr:histidine phosphatase family protein [Hyphomicrobiales bacterium]MCP5372716.1 histidine phosphatase family protein [Hyphomicrobiales bacterium]
MGPIYLVRHGETVWNRVGRHQGHGDSPLSLRGIGQVRAVAALLGGLLDGGRRAGLRVQCSPLFRARQTCAILCDSLGLDYEAVAFDDRLKERAYGHWEGLTHGQIMAAHGDEWAARAADPWHHAARGGETNFDVAARVRAWLDDQHGAGPVLAVAHGSMGKVLRGVYAGLDAAAIAALDEPHTTVYRLEGGGVTAFDAAEEP